MSELFLDSNSISRFCVRFNFDTFSPRLLRFESLLILLSTSAYDTHYYTVTTVLFPLFLSFFLFFTTSHSLRTQFGVCLLGLRTVPYLFSCFLILFAAFFVVGYFMLNFRSAISALIIHDLSSCVGMLEC